VTDLIIKKVTIHIRENIQKKGTHSRGIYKTSTVNLFKFVSKTNNNVSNRFRTRVATAAEVLMSITGFQVTNNSIAPICNPLIRHYFRVIHKACIRKLGGKNRN